MRKRFWVCLAIIVLGLGIMALPILIQDAVQDKPTMDELLNSCVIPPEEITFTPEDFMAAVERSRSWPRETFTAEEAGADMTVYSPSGDSSKNKEDALTLTVLPGGLQYEYFDSEAMILYCAVLPKTATIDTVTAADFEGVSFSATDMERIQELTQ